MSVNAQTITVTEWYESPASSITGRSLSEMSSLAVNSWFRAHVRPAFGDVALSKVTHQRCVELLEDVHDQGLSYGTVFGVYSVLTRIFRSAYRAGVIGEYPCEGLHEYIAPWNTYRSRRVA